MRLQRRSLYKAAAREKNVAALSERHAGWQWLRHKFSGARPPDLSMIGLLRPGAPVLLSPAQNPERKLRWTLELVWCGDPAAYPRGGFWAGVNTSTPNRMLEAAFRAGKLPWAEGYTSFAREKVRGESRLDGLLEGPGMPRLWVECKNVTMSEDDVALFPDAVSERGLKHLGTLKGIVAAGERAAMFYCIQRPDVCCFGPADMIDPAFCR